MNPKDGCDFPVSGTVTSGDFVCSLHRSWEAANGLIGKTVDNGFVGGTNQDVGGWRCCRPILKKKKTDKNV